MSCDRNTETPFTSSPTARSGPFAGRSSRRISIVCDDCVALAADLQKIRDAAATLDAGAPARSRLDADRRAPAPGRPGHRPPVARPGGTWRCSPWRRRWCWRSAGSLYVLRRSRPASAGGDAPRRGHGGASDDITARGNAAATDAVQSITDDLMAAEQHYQSAIAKLQEAAKTDDGSIDPQTAAVLEENHQVIDQAIAESRTALQVGTAERSGARQPVRGAPPEGDAAAGHDRADERDAEGQFRGGGATRRRRQEIVRRATS